MDSGSPAVLGALIVTAILIALNALYVFHEFAFVMIRPIQARKLDESSSQVTQLVSKAVHHLDHYIAVDQLGITVTSIAVGWIGQPALSQLFNDGFTSAGLSSSGVRTLGAVIAFVLLTGMQMVFGELMPKTIALRHPVRVAHLSAVPVEITAKIFHPLVWLLNGLGGIIVRMLGFTPQEEAHAHILPAEELAAVIEMSAREGALEVDPATLRRALNFSDLRASDILVPRQDVLALSAELDRDQVIAQARATGFTRYPVFDRSIDRVIGLFDIKDLIKLTADGAVELAFSWQDAVHPIPTVPEHAPVEQVLLRLGEDRQQMGLVVDEFGGTAGIVTVADIAKWLVGDPAQIVSSDGETFVLQGKTSIAAVETTLGISFGEEENDQDSIGGLIMATLERIPSVGDTVTVEGHELEVAQMKGARITQVLLHPRRRGVFAEDEAPREQGSAG
jgi:CBS domain containing-hemolysin-like protein